MTEKVLQYIKQYTHQHHYAPTIREIAEGVGLKSPSSVMRHINRLLAQGQLETDHPGSPRALRVVDAKESCVTCKYYANDRCNCKKSDGYGDFTMFQDYCGYWRKGVR